jgi:preprotein translocase subunit SecY
VIFAITILSLPLTIVQFANLTGPVATWLTEIFSSSRPIGFTLYVFLIFVFTFFYSFLQVNPEKVATNLSNQNAYIPGVRPGNDTEIYFSKILFKVTLLGAVYLSFVAVVPILTAWAFDLPPTVTVGGTSLLIVVGVAVETFKQITTEANKQEYKGFIR